MHLFLIQEIKANNSKIDSILNHVEDYTQSVIQLRAFNDQTLIGHIENTKDDLSKCKLYNALCWRNFSSNPAKAMEYAKIHQALAEKINDYDAILMSLDNMAYLHKSFGDYEKATSYMLKSLKSKEEKNDRNGVFVSLSGLAGVYYQMNNYELALSYFNKALEIQQIINDKLSIASCYANIGLCHAGLKQVDEAIENYQLAIKLYKSANKENEAASTYSNLGQIYWEELKDEKKALEYFKLAAKLINPEDNPDLSSSINSSLSEIYAIKSDYVKALFYGKKGVEYATLSKNKNKMLSANESYARVLLSINRFDEAFNHYQTAFHLKDSIFNEAASKQIVEMQTKYDVEKKETENKLLKTESQLNKVELEKKSEQQKILLYSLILAALIGVYITYSLQQKKKINKLLNTKNAQISSKNKIIEEKNKDITDSINYAKRIQNAILPDETFIQNFYDSFVYYLPKDIVSGDFYWIKKVDRKLYFSVIDCTGHGVPGAFMSIIGYNSLNRIVEDSQLTETGLILDKLNELVINSIKKQDGKGDQVRDGMDLAFCSIDLDTSYLEYSGANNPMYIVRTNQLANDKLPLAIESNGFNLLEIKADKMAIGGNTNNRNYQTHRIQLRKNDVIYLFSDGYADQFGGPKGKKFMYKRFKELILSIHNQPMSDQKEILNTTLMEWKGSLDQIDDICLMGVRIV